MTPTVYNASLVLGVCFLVAAAYLAAGVAAALGTGGALVLGLAIFGRWVSR